MLRVSGPAIVVLHLRPTSCHFVVLGMTQHWFCLLGSRAAALIASSLQLHNAGLSLTNARYCSALEQT